MTSTLTRMHQIRSSLRISFTLFDHPLPPVEVDDHTQLSGNGRLLSFGSGGRIPVFDTETGQVLAEATVPPEAVALAPNGSYFAIASDDHVDLYWVDSDQTRRIELPPTKFPSTVRSPTLLFVEHG